MIETFMALARAAGHDALAIPAPPERLSVTSRLYVIQIDFPLNEATAQKLDATLDPLRKKYGLDFIVQEPGYSLKQFDEI